MSGGCRFGLVVAIMFFVDKGYECRDFGCQIINEKMSKSRIQRIEVQKLENHQKEVKRLLHHGSCSLAVQALGELWGTSRGSGRAPFLLLERFARNIRWSCSNVGQHCVTPRL